MRRLVATAAMTAALLLPISGTATQAAGLTVKFTSFPSPVKRGTTASVSIHTGADAYCRIKVTYASGVSHAAGLGARYSNGNGNARWSWKVPATTQPGSWPVTVTCQSGSNTGRATKSMQITA